MRTLVTGATGRIGSRLVPHLLNRGDAVRILVRRPDDAEALRALGAEVITGDLHRPETLTGAVAGVDAVLHLAAFFRGATPEAAQAVNLDGTLALAQAALRAGVPRFVFTSTNLIYGPGRGRAATEADEPQPRGAYPASKVQAEEALREFHRSQGLDLRILRLAFVYGEGDPHLSEVARMWLRNWNPQQRLHMVHHADVARAALLALDQADLDGRTYNVADDEPATTSAIMQLTNEPIAPDADSRPIADPWEGIVSTARIREELGFCPLYPTLQAAVAADVL